MSMKKSFFDLTRYMEKDPEFGEFWTKIYQEYQRTKSLVLKLANQSELMQNYPVGKASIEVREEIVLPLLTIQQYALKMAELKDQVRTGEADAIEEILAEIKDMDGEHRVAEILRIVTRP